MTRIEIELADAMAEAAQAAGLLTPHAMARLLDSALRRQQVAGNLLAVAGEVAAAGGEVMSMAEINAEIKAARAERRQRATGY